MSVYTPIHESELKTFLSQYSLGSLQDYIGISAGIENTNYFVNTDQGRYVLTIFEHHTIDELHYFMDLMALLSKSGVPTAKPIQQNSGQILSLLKGKPASLVTCLQGSTLENQQPSLAQCAEIGSALATMHRASQNFPHSRPPDRGVTWRAEMGEQLLQHPNLNAEDQKTLKDELSYQATIDFSALPSGVIHADLFRDNAMFVDDKLSGMIDFYYACNDNFIFDMAVVVNDWCCCPERGIDQQKLNGFLKAYTAVRPLETIEKHYWSATLRAAALRFWLSRLQDKLYPREGELTQLKDPDEFKNKLTMLIANKALSDISELNYG